MRNLVVFGVVIVRLWCRGMFIPSMPRWNLPNRFVACCWMITSGSHALGHVWRVNQWPWSSEIIHLIGIYAMPFLPEFMPQSFHCNLPLWVKKFAFLLRSLVPRSTSMNVWPFATDNGPNWRNMFPYSAIDSYYEVGHEMPPALEAVHFPVSLSGTISKSTTVTARLNIRHAVVGLPPAPPNIGGAG